MILTKDNKKNGKGTRTLANEDFAKVPEATRTKLLNATVLIKTSDNRGIGTGVILNTATVGQTTTAYVLTARHLLGTLSGADMKKKKPSECVTQAFLNKLQLFYGPTAIETKPANGPVAVTGVNTQWGAKDDWSYDIMVLESTNAQFCAFIEGEQNNAGSRFVTVQLYPKYVDLLSYKTDDQKDDNKDEKKDEKTNNKAASCQILNRDNYTYLQMGYGAGTEKENGVKPPKGWEYENKQGLIQCRWPTIGGKMPLKSAFDIDEQEVKGKPTPVCTVSSEYEKVVEVSANDSSSTGPGDSGGPLFAFQQSKKGIDYQTFYLVGVTSGRNFFSEPGYKNKPETAPKKNIIRNNISTYWDDFFKAWNWWA